MQDIIPPNSRRSARGALRAPVRAALAPVERIAPVYRTSYTRQTKVISDVLRNEEVVVTETFTTTYEPPTAEFTPSVSIKAIESLSSEEKAEVLQRAFFNAERALKKERRKRKDLKRFGLVFVASVFVLVTGYVSIDTIVTNNRVKAETSQQQEQSVAWATTKENEGKDETVPTAANLSDYSVAASLPRALYIEKLNVASRVLPMSVNTDGSVQAPINIFDAGWYNGSVKPGEIGAMFIDGHASGPTREGLFAYLDTLVKGDKIQVEKGDGSKLTYKVVHTEVVKLSELDMKKMLLPYGNALRGLNLMTCTGDWVDAEYTYDQRVLVWTEQV
jgi:LPXTG-site transpeptidase (sortase) family protein